MEMISIITVVRNGISTLEQTILSVLNQDYPNFEYIIIDGFSTDGTLDLIELYSERIRYISEPDNGIYDAMNKGLLLANGEWVYFLGCDDILYNRSTLSTFFLDRTLHNYDVVYGNVLFKHSNRLYDGAFDHEKMVNRSICHQAIFYRKIVFDIQGYFSTEYKTASDYIFNIKLYCFNSSKWFYFNEIVAVYNEFGLSKEADKKFMDDSFAIRYDTFKVLNSKFILSKIFWSSFFRFFRTHDLSRSRGYVFLILKDVGLWALFRNLIVLVNYKYLHDS